MLMSAWSYAGNNITRHGTPPSVLPLCQQKSLLGRLASMAIGGTERGAGESGGGVGASGAGVSRGCSMKSRLLRRFSAR